MDLNSPLSKKQEAKSKKKKNRYGLLNHILIETIFVFYDSANVKMEGK